MSSRSFAIEAAFYSKENVKPNSPIMAIECYIKNISMIVIFRIEVFGALYINKKKEFSNKISKKIYALFKIVGVSTRKLIFLIIYLMCIIKHKIFLI